MGQLTQEPGMHHTACQGCGLYRTCRTPFVDVVNLGIQGRFPKVKDPIVIVGEYPTEEDDNAGELIGSTRERYYALLLRTLKKNNVNLEECLYVTAIRCAPGYRQKVLSKHINACRTFFLPLLDDLKPRAVLLLGNSALRIAFKKGGITKERRVRKQLTLTDGSNVACAVAFSPSYPLRDINQMERFEGDIAFFVQHVVRSKSTTSILPYVNLHPTVQILRNFHESVLRKGLRIAFDVEADELHVYKRDDWKLLCLSVSDGKRTYVTEVDPCNAPTLGRIPHLNDVHKAMLDIITDKRIPKVMHNGKYDMHATFARTGKRLRNFATDTMVLHSLCFPITGGHDLKGVASELLSVHDYTHELRAIIGEGKDSKRYGKVPYPILGKYCGYDTWCTARIAPVLEKRVAHLDRQATKHGIPYAKSSKVFGTVVMPAVRSLWEMERAGFHVRMPYLRQLSLDMESRVVAAREKLRSMSIVQEWQHATLKKLKREADKGKDLTEKKALALHAKSLFNPNSNDHVAEVVFGEDYFGCESTKKTSTGKEASGKDILTELARIYTSREFTRFITLLRECKQTAHYRSTYVEGLAPLVDARSRVHASTRVFGADTGRGSMADPNLQNIPREDEMRNLFGARKGHKLIDADYSQVELRVLAALSGDKRMVNVYKSGRDLHTETAIFVYGHKKAEQVTKEQRQACKAVNFGVVYCIGKRTLSANLTTQSGRDVSEDEAQMLIDQFFATYPGVEDWQMEIKEFAALHGYVYTMFGTRRLLGNATLKGNDFEQRRLREDAFRQACNTPVQGTAGLATLTAITKLTREFKRRKLPARIVSTVHDNIITEAENGCVDEVIALERDVMINEPLRFIGEWMNGVPIEVDFKIGTKWGAVDKQEKAA